MINFHKAGTSQTIAIWPEVSSSYAASPSGSFYLELTQDYDQSTTEVAVDVLNTPTSFQPRLIISVPTDQIPAYSGYYDVKLYEFIIVDALIWSTTNITWSDAAIKWSAPSGKSEVRLLDEDRGHVSGSDYPTTNQYLSPNETGSYTTYHN